MLGGDKLSLKIFYRTFWVYFLLCLLSVLPLVAAYFGVLGKVGWGFLALALLPLIVGSHGILVLLGQAIIGVPLYQLLLSRNQVKPQNVFVIGMLTGLILWGAAWLIPKDLFLNDGNTLGSLLLKAWWFWIPAGMLNSFLAWKYIKEEEFERIRRNGNMYVATVKTLNAEQTFLVCIGVSFLLSLQYWGPVLWEVYSGGTFNGRETSMSASKWLFMFLESSIQNTVYWMAFLTLGGWRIAKLIVSKNSMHILSYVVAGSLLFLVFHVCLMALSNFVLFRRDDLWKVEYLLRFITNGVPLNLLTGACAGLVLAKIAGLKILDKRWLRYKMS